jgi:hypothetical protein
MAPIIKRSGVRIKISLNPAQPHPEISGGFRSPEEPAGEQPSLTWGRLHKAQHRALEQDAGWQDPMLYG